VEEGAERAKGEIVPRLEDDDDVSRASFDKTKTIFKRNGSAKKVISRLSLSSCPWLGRLPNRIRRKGWPMASRVSDKRCIRAPSPSPSPRSFRITSFEGEARKVC